MEVHRTIIIVFSLDEKNKDLENEKNTSEQRKEQKYIFRLMPEQIIWREVKKL